ncbi:hypothetical protein BM221_001758 [Beauveria bassiana]|uniref:Uncharacterized protein n=1 Tax=Beauveria bassiana TaxID=176275 RepID=A0A2N6NWM4_BEABA|nr:hypothetical protein BM221_001758 [Beauveria bassiana]
MAGGAQPERPRWRVSLRVWLACEERGKTKSDGRVVCRGEKGGGMAQQRTLNGGGGRGGWKEEERTSGRADQSNGEYDWAGNMVEIGCGDD